MKLSHACGYALRALTYLARHDAGGMVTAHTIAEAQRLPGRYVRKTLEALASAGVLHAVKGPNGGYRLARAAGSITLLEIVERVDGPVRRAPPRVGAGGAARLDRRLQAVCDAVAEGVRRRLGKVSLADLAGRGK
jgi:Rrf2 family protein